MKLFVLRVSLTIVSPFMILISEKTETQKKFGYFRFLFLVWKSIWEEDEYEFY